MSSIITDFLRLEKREKVVFVADSTKSAELGNVIGDATTDQLNVIASVYQTVSRSATKAFINGTAYWDANTVLPTLMNHIRNTSGNDKETAAIFAGNLIKHHWSTKKNEFEKFINQNTGDEVKSAVVRVCGSKIFKNITVANPVPQTTPEARAMPSSPAAQPTKHPRESEGTPQPPSKKVAVLSADNKKVAQEAFEEPAPSKVVCKLSDVKFADMKLEPATLRSIREVFGFEFMTPVQAATLPVIKTGLDVLAKAKTGTGKTLAFLIPQADRMLISPPKSSRDISVLVIAPTRELALQIVGEGEKLFKFQPGVVVTSVIGGTKMPRETRILSGNVDVLVATPGRLLDHLASDRQFADRMRASLRTLVFDECDQLMNMGFVKELDKIVAYLPGKDVRQTLLFSATVPDAIAQLAHKYCKTDKNLTPSAQFGFIDCVLDEPATHTQVDQTFLETPVRNHLPILYHLLSRQTGNKAIVFFQTARGAQIAAECFAKTPLANTHAFFEIHSRKSQAQRTKAQDGFGAHPLSKPAVLFSSDASARGVDYPGVELVVQLGAPTDKEQYIHRLGRTARAGKSGTGILLVDACEGWMTRQITGDSAITVVKNSALAALTDAALSPAVEAIAAGMDKVSRETKSQSYQAWLGYFNTFCSKMRWTKDALTTEASLYARYILRYDLHLPVASWQPPSLRKDTVGKMALRDVPGLSVEGRSYDFRFNERIANGYAGAGSVPAVTAAPVSRADERVNAGGVNREHNRDFQYNGGRGHGNGNRNNGNSGRGGRRN